MLKSLFARVRYPISCGEATGQHQCRVRRLLALPVRAGRLAEWHQIDSIGYPRS